MYQGILRRYSKDKMKKNGAPQAKDTVGHSNKATHQYFIFRRRPSVMIQMTFCITLRMVNLLGLSMSWLTAKRMISLQVEESVRAAKVLQMIGL